MTDELKIRMSDVILSISNARIIICGETYPHSGLEKISYDNIYDLADSIGSTVGYPMTLLNGGGLDDLFIGDVFIPKWLAEHVGDKIIRSILQDEYISGADEYTISTFQLINAHLYIAMHHSAEYSYDGANKSITVHLVGVHVYPQVINQIMLGSDERLQWISCNHSFHHSKHGFVGPGTKNIRSEFVRVGGLPVTRSISDNKVRCELLLATERLKNRTL